jgi:hypothetical protein
MASSLWMPSRRVAACRVAVQHLQQESLERHHWIELPRLPDMPDRAAQREDCLGVECPADIVLELHELPWIASPRDSLSESGGG